MKKSSFYHTPLHSTPQLGGFPSEYRHPVLYGKTRMVSLPDGEKKFEDMFIRFDVIHERDRRTDGRTDRRTDRHCMTAKTTLASHRAVKIQRSCFQVQYRRPTGFLGNFSNPSTTQNCVRIRQTACTLSLPPGRGTLEQSAVNSHCCVNPAFIPSSPENSSIHRIFPTILVILSAF